MLPQSYLVLLVAMGDGFPEKPVGVVEFTDKSEWETTVKEFTTISFTEYPDGTLITDQYGELGIFFTDEVNIINYNPSSFLIDDFGLNGVLTIDLAFTIPQVALAADYPGAIHYRLYFRGILVGETAPVPTSGDGHFLGVISAEPFDTAVVIDPPGFSHVFADDLHFSSAIVDCNGNGLHDYGETGLGLTPDCNGNHVPDECDVSSGESDDCNENGIPDECEVSQRIEPLSPPITPIGSPLQPEYSFGVLPPSATNVSITIAASADLSAVDEFISVYINGELIGHIFIFEEVDDCADPPNEAQLVLTAAQYNALHAPGSETTFTLDPSPTMNPNLCDGTSFITIALSYQSYSPTDLDLNGVPDACRGDSCPADLDGSGAVGFADLLLLLEAWSTADRNADLDDSGGVDFGDLLVLLNHWGPCDER